MKKNGKNVQSAAATQPDQSSQPVVPTSDAGESAPSLINLENIPKDKIEMAKSFGIDLEAIFAGVNAWQQSVEARLAEIQKTLPNWIQKKFEEQQVILKTTIEQQRNALGTPPQQQEQGGGTDLKTILPLFNQVMGSGGGGVDAATLQYAELGKEVAGISNFVFKEVLKKALPGVIEQWEASKPKPVVASP